MILVLVPAPAHAGVIKDNLARLIRKIGIHGNGSYRHPLDRDVTKGWGYGVSIGLSPGHTNGWKYPFALTFLTQDLHSPNGDEFARSERGRFSEASDTAGISVGSALACSCKRATR